MKLRNPILGNRAKFYLVTRFKVPADGLPAFLITKNKMPYLVCLWSGWVSQLTLLTSVPYPALPDYSTRIYIYQNIFYRYYKC